jgi:hypothetical protein
VAEALDRLAQGANAEVEVGLVLVEPLPEGSLKVLEGVEALTLPLGDIEDEIADPVLERLEIARLGLGARFLPSAVHAGFEIAQILIGPGLQGQRQANGPREGRVDHRRVLSGRLAGGGFVRFGAGRQRSGQLHADLGEFLQQPQPPLGARDRWIGRLLRRSALVGSGDRHEPNNCILRYICQVFWPRTAICAGPSPRSIVISQYCDAAALPNLAAPARGAERSRGGPSPRSRPPGRPAGRSMHGRAPAP